MFFLFKIKIVKLPILNKAEQNIRAKMTLLTKLIELTSFLRKMWFPHLQHS
ncbi:hypothetical protein D3C87_238660 [compost metagenome]|nr:hypothetical protein SAMN04487898_10944 [Pedobacter sp. ok626]